VSWLRPLGQTGLTVSALGFGTVKFGRNEGVKYPTGFSLPDDRAARALLDLARDLGINLIDTAPAYGSSEERLGRLLDGRREDWVVCTKVGEEFEGGRSHFDFTPEHTRFSVERSLRRLNCDCLDVVLVHSDGNDLDIVRRLGTLETLAALKQEGKLRSFGLSGKTVDGGLAALPVCDLLMVTYNLSERDQAPLLDACAESGKGVLIKKALASGHLDRLPDDANPPGEDPVVTSMKFVLGHPGTTAAVIGTITPEHLRSNVEAAHRALAG
jgi:aryl-alcohol dehydrogenase-like predicted oxidoreductase